MRHISDDELLRAVAQGPEAVRKLLEQAHAPVQIPIEEARKRYEHMELRDAVAEARRIIEDAERDLGKDLGGYSRLDLLADNLPFSLNELKLLLVIIEASEIHYERLVEMLRAQGLMIRAEES